jgi:hypothetical protein
VPIEKLPVEPLQRHIQRRLDRGETFKQIAHELHVGDRAVRELMDRHEPMQLDWVDRWCVRLDTTIALEYGYD